MTAKLDIEYIELRNFLSYGDYVTRLDVANLGPVLILGDTEGSGSNGAGKSSLLTAFIWCLFGRTITSHAPGDKVTNWYTKKNCYVKIKTADGWEIIRTRNFDGHNELMLRKDRDDATQSTNTNAQKNIDELFCLDYEIFTSSVFCGQFGKSFLEMSPAKRKETIERLLGLDRLNGFADAAKEQFKQVESQQDLARGKIENLKADIERQNGRLANNLESKDQFEGQRSVKLQTASERLDEVEEQLNRLQIPNVDKLKIRWDTANSILEKISSYKDKIRENQLKAQSLGDTIGRVGNYSDIAGFPYEVPDIDSLKKDHEQADEADEKFDKTTEIFKKFKDKLYRVMTGIDQDEEKIESWINKSNTDCNACGQEIDESHVKAQTADVKVGLGSSLRIRDSLVQAMEQLSDDRNKYAKMAKLRPKMSIAEAVRLENLNSSIRTDLEATAINQEKMEREKAGLLKANEKLETAVVSITERLDKVKPIISLAEVTQLQAFGKSLESRKEDLAERFLELKSEANPYGAIAEDLLKSVEELEKETDAYEEKISQLGTLFSHYKYIYRSYSDRRKIKSWLLSELIPFLNDRVQYYLDMLDIDMQIKFNSTLNAETDRWGYEFCSGGERKRIDLAIMFGLYDLYMSIYGKQCNIMVLDEVDSRLDDKGVEAFSEIINDICTNDERPRPSTIFVISHKQELQSLFPSQVTIKKNGNFSSIDRTVFSSD